MGQTRKVTTKSKEGGDIEWRVEEIKNGYVVTKCWEEKIKGKDFPKWNEEKYFTEKNPLENFKPDMDIIENSLEQE